MKKIPKTIFQIIAVIILLTYIGLFIYWVVTFSGPWEYFVSLTLDEKGYYVPVVVFFLTFLSTVIPLLVVLFVLRRFSDLPTLRDQLRNDTSIRHLLEKKTSIKVQTYDIPSTWSRILVYIVERAVVIGFILLFVVPIMFFLNYLCPEGSLAKIIGIIICIIVLTCAIVYFFIKDGFGGQSIVRRWFGQQVVYLETGQAIGFWTSTKREIVLRLILPIEFIILLFNGEKRRVGDYWSKSIVIKKRVKLNDLNIRKSHVAKYKNIDGN